MALTTHGLPKPGLSDPPNGPAQIGALADSLDAQLLSTVTTLPSSPVDGQRCLFLADATNGVVWDLRYRSASSSTYKWELAGGGSLTAELSFGESTTSSSNVDLATVGPAITVPLAGDYEIDFGATAGITLPGTGAVTINSQIVIKIGSATPAVNDWAELQIVTDTNTGTFIGAMRRKIRRTVSAASTVVKIQYLSDGTHTVTFRLRDLALRPIRVG